MKSNQVIHVCNPGASTEEAKLADRPKALRLWSGRLCHQEGSSEAAVIVVQKLPLRSWDKPPAAVSSSNTGTFPHAYCSRLAVSAWPPTRCQCSAPLLARRLRHGLSEKSRTLSLPSTPTSQHLEVNSGRYRKNCFLFQSTFFRSLPEYFGSLDPNHDEA